MFAYAESFDQDLCPWLDAFGGAEVYNNIFIGTSCPSTEDPSPETDAGTGFFYFSPICYPCMAPSSAPSETPSGAPSETPSLAPSGIPSETPSGNPSGQPSLGPSELPSLSPSDLPSLNPSDSPSSEPSSGPSETPSGMPSMGKFRTVFQVQESCIEGWEAEMDVPSFSLSLSLSSSNLQGF